MNIQAKPKSEDTRERIMACADALFRRLGCGKTTVADIAGELGMSPANIYRFFSSKTEIVEAICQRCLGNLEEKAWAVARARGPAGARLERLVLEILNYHKENLLVEKRVHDMVLVAIENSWGVIEAHKDVLRTVTELIIRDGIEAGEFEAVDPRETARIIQRALVAFEHPVLIATCLAHDMDVDAEARATVQFLLRAITPRS